MEGHRMLDEGIEAAFRFEELHDEGDTVVMFI